MYPEGESMKDYTNKEKNKKSKKKIIASLDLVIIVIVALYAVTVWNNINYSVNQLQEIALERIPGEIEDVKRELEIEDAAIEYTFYIRDNENMIREITVSTKSGGITYMESSKE